MQGVREKVVVLKNQRRRESGLDSRPLKLEWLVMGSGRGYRKILQPQVTRFDGGEWPNTSPRTRQGVRTQAKVNGILDIPYPAT